MASDRERLLARLQEEGDRRRAAKASDRDALDALAKLIPEAVQAGITKREIARRSEVSRPWIDELLKRTRRSG